MKWKEMGENFFSSALESGFWLLSEKELEPFPKLEEREEPVDEEDSREESLEDGDEELDGLEPMRSNKSQPLAKKEKEMEPNIEKVIAKPFFFINQSFCLCGRPYR